MDNEQMEKQVIKLVDIQRLHMVEDEVQVGMIDMLDRFLILILKDYHMVVIQLKVEIFEHEDDDEGLVMDDDMDENEQYVLCGEQVVHFQIMQNEKINIHNHEHILGQHLIM